MNVIIKKWNRLGRGINKLSSAVIPGNPRRLIVWYDDLSKAKKPKAWMKHILFDQDAA